MSKLIAAIIALLFWLGLSVGFIALVVWAVASIVKAVFL